VRDDVIVFLDHIRAALQPKPRIAVIDNAAIRK
jgi:hypothetical protein